MVVDARLGLSRDRVIVGGTAFEVRRGRDGWRRTVDAGAQRRVRYDAWRDRLLIESPEGSCEIRFRWRNTTFSWRDHTYRIRPSMWGAMTILDGDRSVAEGRGTWSGFRFQFVGDEFRPIERELAVGLGLRTVAFATVV